MPLQLRRGTAAEKADLNQPLAQGEPLWITDTGKLYIGDGATLAQNLEPVVGYGDEEAQDAAAAIFVNGNHSDISFDYLDGSNLINATVSVSQLTQNLDMNNFNIEGTGNIDIDGNLTIAGDVQANAVVGDYKGSVFGDDSVLLVDAVESAINLEGTIKGNLTPASTGIFSLGTPSLRFTEAYLSQSLWIGTAQINAEGASIDLPAGSTVNGQPLGEIAQPGNGLKIDIVGEDSSLIVDSSTNTVSGSFIGELNGSVFADDSTTIIDGSTGEINTPNLNTSNLNTSFITSNIPELNFTSAVGNSTINIISDDTPGILAIRKEALDEDLSGTVQAYGRLVFGRNDLNGNLITSFVAGNDLAITFGVDATATFADTTKFVTWTGTSFGIGKLDPSKTLDVNGDAFFEGDVEAAAFKGSIVGDDSTTIVNAVEGSISASSFVQFGSFTTSERNNLSAVNGMVIYNTTDNRFQGFQNSAWINLDDGTLA